MTSLTQAQGVDFYANLDSVIHSQYRPFSPS